MAAVQTRSCEFLWLHNAHAAGPVIGKIGEEEIAETVIDQFGRAYTYSGLAPRAWNGKLDLDRLQAGEFLLKNGLVYRLTSKPTTWVNKLIEKIRHLRF